MSDTNNDTDQQNDPAQMFASNQSDCDEDILNGDEQEATDEEFDDEEDEGDESEDESNNENDEDDDDDTEESEDEMDDACESITTPIKAPLSPNSVPPCYICLNEFDGQDVGNPDSCENIHHFCLECIEEWSKRINTCPVDRKTFSFIFVKRAVNGEVIMKLPVTKNSVVEIESMDDDVTYCEICGRCDREDRLLLCDGCDFGYHCECLSPPLETIPIDDWFCPECSERRQATIRPQSSLRRAIARTGTFEIVRNRILARRIQQPVRRATPKRKRKTKRTRKARKTKGTAKRTKRRKTKRRRSRKSKLSYKRLPSASVRSRIASKLGITCKPKAPFGLPSMKSSGSELRASLGIGSLSMFGYGLELNNPSSYDDDYEFESSFGGGVGLLSQARNHLSHSSKCIKAPISLNQMSSTDLLSDIMNSQEVLHAPSCDLTISRDGRVHLKTEAKTKKCPDSHSSSSSNSSSSTNNDKNNNGNGYVKQSNYTEQANVNRSEGDISLIKPSPIVTLHDDRIDLELYSDIESLGDNKEEPDDIDKKQTLKAITQCDKETPKKLSDDSFGKSEIDDNCKIDSLNESKPSDIEDVKSRKKPSIKDLFGGDSDDEVDEELKQLVAQQGSINVHYPIKMPIVLKTNFLNDKTEGELEVPISKKWIPIYPETEKSKNTGPKWKAFGLSDADKNNDLKLISLTKNGAPLENVKARVISNAENSKKEKVPDFISSKKQDIIFEKKSSTGQVSVKREEKSVQNDLIVCKSKATDESHKKVRVCKHGRVLKSKTSEKGNDSTRKRSHEHMDKNDTTNEFSTISKSDISRGSKKFKTLEFDDKYSSLDLDWKKLPSEKPQKERKYHNTDVTYKERDTIKSESYSRSNKISLSSEKRSEIREDKSDRHSRHKTDYEIGHKSSTSSKSLTRKLESRPELELKDRGNRSNSSSHRVSSKSDDKKSRKHTGHHYHKHSDDNHRHRHHRHHSEKSIENKATTSKKSLPSSKETFDAKPYSNYQPYSMIKKVETKEIYSEGDKIIINVNFKRDENSEPNGNDTHFKFRKDIQVTRKAENVHEIKDSSRNSHAENHNDNDILSPQSTDYSNAHLECDNSITSPFPDEVFDEPSETNLKKVLTEEFNFLPRILQLNDSNGSNEHSTKTAEDFLNDEDSFMPTPTQDESHSPLVNSTNNTFGQRLKKPNKSDSILSTSPIETKDDFYDPELPLQSPDRDSIKSPSKDKSSYESAYSPKDSPDLKRESHVLSKSNLLSTSSSSLSSTVAAAAATLASLNSVNLAHLIEIANKIGKDKNNNGTSLKMSQSNNKSQQSGNTLNRDIIEIVDMDVDSPSPLNSPQHNRPKNSNTSLTNVKEIWESIVKSTNAKLGTGPGTNSNNFKSSDKKKSGFKFDEATSSRTEPEGKDKYVKKLNRLERVVDEIKLSLKPYYQKNKISKEDYKEILRKAVPKVCHSKSGEINPHKIKNLVEAYIKRYRHMRKKANK